MYLVKFVSNIKNDATAHAADIRKEGDSDLFPIYVECEDQVFFVFFY